MDDVPEWILEGARMVGENRKSFRQMLETYTPKTGYSAPMQPRILDIGCGYCYEAYVLSGYFGGNPDGFDSENVSIVGIDIDPEKIRIAQSQHKRIVSGEKYTEYIDQPNYIFISGDAKKTRQLVDGKFDIIVARHPNVAEAPETWNNIFLETYETLKGDGLLIGTSFSDIEHDILVEQIKQTGYSIILNKRNKYAIPTQWPEVSIDRNVIFARKKV